MISQLGRALLLYIRSWVRSNKVLEIFLTPRMWQQRAYQYMWYLRLIQIRYDFKCRSWLFLLNLYPSWIMMAAFSIRHEICWVWPSVCFSSFDSHNVWGQIGIHINTLTKYVEMRVLTSKTISLAKRNYVQQSAHAHISHNFKKPASADVFAFEFSGKYHAQWPKCPSLSFYKIQNAILK